MNNRRTESISAAQAGANLAIIQSTVRVVTRCLVAVFFLEVFISAARVALNIPTSLWFAVARGVLMAVLLLPIFYRLVLRPVAELAAKQAAAAAEARFDVIAQAAGDAIVISDVDWKLHFVNPAAEKMFGLQPGEWTKAPLESFLPEQTKQFLEAARAQYRETGKPALAGRGMFELELQRSDGSRFSAELCVSELREGRRSLFVST
ncbi:MAG TPA: PAS domain-containing protein, partial [Candidatus Acidoferrales bacterium]|nr:PAS domain-containing protein [Candidatus Acidoferrales bacterium]